CDPHLPIYWVIPRHLDCHGRWVSSTDGDLAADRYSQRPASDADNQLQLWSVVARGRPASHIHSLRVWRSIAIFVQLEFRRWGQLYIKSSDTHLFIIRTIHCYRYCHGCSWRFCKL